MEFHEKLQELRKRKGLTQEELAAALFVSRTAVSKWESGRGTPNLDSLKAISSYFGVTLDQLLSTDEALHLAENNQQQRAEQFCDLLFGLLDLSVLLFLFLPLFGQNVDGIAVAVSLFRSEGISSYLRILCLSLFSGMILVGIATLALQNFKGAFWKKNKRKISLILHTVSVFLLVLSKQPYAAATLILLLIIKAFTLFKQK